MELKPNEDGGLEVLLSDKDIVSLAIGRYCLDSKSSFYTADQNTLVRVSRNRVKSVPEAILEGNNLTISLPELVLPAIVHRHNTKDSQGVPLDSPYILIRPESTD